MTRRTWFAAIYIAWIAICSIGFASTRSAPDPSRRAGRILANDAGARAVAVLEKRGLRGYEAVHVAAEGNRWIVLCDTVPHTALRDALVVELRGADGSLLTIRKPVD